MKQLQHDLGAEATKTWLMLMLSLNEERKTAVFMSI